MNGLHFPARYSESKLESHVMKMRNVSQPNVWNDYTGEDRPECSHLSSTVKQSRNKLVVLITLRRDPWVAQQFGACLWPGARSSRPGIESHVGIPVHGACSPFACVSAPLSLSLCV